MQVKKLKDVLHYIDDEYENIEREEDGEEFFYIEDIERVFKEDMKSGDGFLITDKNGSEKNKPEVRMENGIFSPKFGSIWQDENAFKELYSCKCGKTQGRAMLGMTCEHCGEKVIYKYKNLNITGYFDLGNYKLMHPELFKMLGSLIGKKRFYEILKPDWKTGSDGKPVKPIINEKTKSIDKYQNIGIIEFMNRFDEIALFFKNKHKNKSMIYDFIMENRSKLFIKHIPVISLILRPIVIEDEDYSFTPLNKEYAIMSTKIYNLNHKYPNVTESNDKIVNKLLLTTQQRYDSVSQMLQQSLNKKKGLIRNNIHGNRYNFSSRGVIVPMKDGKVNEIRLSYLHFLTMGRPFILYYLCKMYDINISKAFTMWSNALVEKDERLYAIMQYIVKKHEMYVMLNRNPSLNFGSISKMRIKEIKDDITDLTISVPINILGVFAGDFDGDALNALLLIDKDLVEKYKLFDPRTSMVISRNDGLFDNNFNLIKDQIICLHQICKLGNADNVIKITKLDNEVEDKDVRQIKVYHVE